MQRHRKISLAFAGGASALLVFSICAVQYVCNLPQCGAYEGHMRELIGFLVARGGAEQAAAQMAVGIHHRIPCEQIPCRDDRACRVHAPISSTRVRTECALADSFSSGTPITIVYAREKFPRDAIEKIAGAIPALACSIEAPGQCQALPGARRI
jgi:hypothetical protein